MVNKIKDFLNKAKQSGFFHIIVSSSLVKIVSFVSAMLLPRIISNKADYGLLVYVDNIRSYILLLNGIGIANAVIRYCTKADEEGKKKGYFLVTVAIGILFDILLILFTVLAFIFVPIPFEGAKELSLMLSVLPVFVFLLEDIQLFLRACFENKKYASLNFIYVILMMVLQVLFALLWNLNGVVVGRYVATIASIIIGILFLRQLKEIKVRARFPHITEIVSIIKFGVVMMLSNASSIVMQLNETFFLGSIIRDQTALADYKVASYMLIISTFLVQSVAIFIGPFFAKHRNDKVWIWSHYKKIMIINALIMIPLHIVLALVTKPFVWIVFGEQYLNAVPIMQTLLIASLFQTTIRIITGNVLALCGGEKFNLLVNVVSIVVHTAVDIWAIKTFGIYGAAAGLIVVYAISGTVMSLYLKKLCKKHNTIREIE